MKRNHTRILASVLALVLVMSGVVMSAGQVNAASRPKVTMKTLWEGYDNDINLFAVYDNMDDNMVFKTVKSSNKKVIRVRKNGSSGWDVHLIPKKTGKSTITIKYKLNGKEYTDRAVMRVKKYPAPLASLTAGGKKVNLKKNKYNFDIYNYSKKTGSFKVKAAKGWKITGVICLLRDNPKDKNDMRVKELPKSYATKGKTVSFPKKYNTMLLSVHMKNEKGEWLEYVVSFNRGSK